MKDLKRTLSVAMFLLFVVSVFSLSVFAATVKERTLTGIQYDEFIIKDVQKTTGRDSLKLDTRKSDINSIPYFDVHIPGGFGNAPTLEIYIKYTVEGLFGINKYHTSERVYNGSVYNHTSQNVKRSLAFSHAQHFNNLLYFDTNKTGKLKMYVTCDTPQSSGIHFLTFDMYFEVTY